jgi:outer membrane protein OmpA-like peptidoglycan-associated protein
VQPALAIRLESKPRGVPDPKKEDDMKNRIFATLLLSTALALPVFAQLTNSASGAQPPARDQSDFWDGDEPGLAWLIFHPFASKGYVLRHVETIQDHINELNEVTASNSKMIRDVDARAQQGIQLASTKTKIADEHALEATNKVQIAQQGTAAVATRLSTVETMVGNIDQYKSAPQTEIRFRPGQTVLSKQAKDALDEIATQLRNQHGYVIEVQGFSSGHSQAAIANSRKMADSVARYLVLNHEIPAYRIYVIGMGNAPVAKRRSGTRVEISLLKNDLEQTAKQ